MRAESSKTFLLLHTFPNKYGFFVLFYSYYLFILLFDSVLFSYTWDTRNHLEHTLQLTIVIFSVVHCWWSHAPVPGFTHTGAASFLGCLKSRGE